MLHTHPTSFLLSSCLLAAAAAAQCTITWPNNVYGSANAGIRAATLGNDGQLLIGGGFTDIAGVAANRIARYDGTAWQPFGSGMNGDVQALLRLSNGDLIAGGSFTTSGGVTTNSIARWSGGVWSALGSGIDPVPLFGASITALAQLGNGDLVVAGTFTSASGVTCNNIARWNGSAFAALGTGTNGAVRALAVLGNGDLVATGAFTTAGGAPAASIARWNGASWSALGTGLGVFGGTALAVMPNGDLMVGGSFATAGGVTVNRVARWNGTTWSALGTGLNGAVATLRALPTGDLLAGGVFTTAGGNPAQRIARWDGAAWSAFGAGADASVSELVLLPFGQVVAAGEFANAGGNPAGRIARLDSSCAPGLAVLGAGCAGAGGPNVLVATQLPLLGGSFQALGTGMPPLGIVLVVTGLSSTSLPLSLALPQALPGCTLFANADFVDAVLPVGGQASSSLAMPINPTLIGAAFFHQYVPLELDFVGNITAVTASNALQVTIGSF